MTLRILLVMSALQTLMGCGNGFQPIPSSLNGSNSQSSTTPTIALQAKQVLQARCAACHDAQSGAQTDLSYITDMPRLGSSQFVIPGNPGLSPLYQRISNGTMPPGAPLPANEALIISNWINDLAVQPTPTPTPMIPPTTMPTPIPTPTPLLSMPNPLATYTYISQIVLPKCLGCHGSSGGYSYSNYANTLKSVKPNSPMTSPFYTSINSGRMPKGGSRIPATDIKAVYDWIAAGALNN